MKFHKSAECGAKVSNQNETKSKWSRSFPKLHLGQYKSSSPFLPLKLSLQMKFKNKTLDRKNLQESWQLSWTCQRFSLSRCLSGQKKIPKLFPLLSSPTFSKLFPQKFIFIVPYCFSANKRGKRIPLFRAKVGTNLFGTRATSLSIMCFQS